MNEWIKVRLDLLDDPAVLSIARTVELDPYSVVGRLVRLWCWADRHTANGTARNIFADWVDRFVECTGFARAMQDVDWLQFDDNGLVFPRFGLHNGDSAKKRSLDARRKADVRSGKRPPNVRKPSAKAPQSVGAPSVERPENVRIVSDCEADKKAKTGGPEEEEELDIKTTPPNPPRGAGGLLREAIAKRWGIPGETKAQRAWLDRLVAEFESRGATAEQIERRASAMAARWPNIPQSPETLAKHWAEFAEAAAPNRRELAAATCRESGHVYDHPADVGCSRCGTATLSRARELCGRYGHRPNARGACTRCGEGPAKADPAAGNGQHVNGEATVEVAR